MERSETDGCIRSTGMAWPSYWTSWSNVRTFRLSRLKNISIIPLLPISYLPNGVWKQPSADTHWQNFTAQETPMPPSQQLKLNVCDCSRIHLTYGSITLHFEREEFLAFAMQLTRMAAHVSNTAGFRKVPGLADTETTTCHWGKHSSSIKFDQGKRTWWPLIWGRNSRNISWNEIHLSSKGKNPCSLVCWYPWDSFFSASLACGHGPESCCS